MKRKTRKTLNIPSDRAAYALHVLIAEGKIAVGDVTAALNRREQLIRELRQRLVALEQGAVTAIVGTGRKIARKTTRKPTRRMTPARRAALKLHGRYLGHVRTLPKGAKATVKAIREKSGVHAAIKAARKMAKPSISKARAQQGGQDTRPNYQSSQQRKLARYQEREQPKPDKHGGSGAGRQQGGSGAGRERG